MKYIKGAAKELNRLTDIFYGFWKWSRRHPSLAVNSCLKDNVFTAVTGM